MAWVLHAHSPVTNNTVWVTDNVDSYLRDTTKISCLFSDMQCLVTGALAVDAVCTTHNMRTVCQSMCWTSHHHG